MKMSLWLKYQFVAISWKQGIEPDYFSISCPMFFSWIPLQTGYTFKEGGSFHHLIKDMADTNFIRDLVTHILEDLSEVPAEVGFVILPPVPRYIHGKCSRARYPNRFFCMAVYEC